MVICARCGGENPAGAHFCNACGAPLEDVPSGSSGERKIVTVLFADVTGSTALGERLDPEPLKEVMGSFFAAMREEIEAEGGTVEKFIGDAVMAAFGVPRVHEDDPARALRSALRMRSRLRDLNRTLSARHGVELELRTGVNTGEVLAASNPRPGEPLATGDTVNAAARLEQAARPGQVLVADRTAQAARGFLFGEPRTLDIRGKKEPVRAVELLGQQANTQVTSPEIPLVGRTRELALLVTTYGHVADENRPSLVTLYGEAGVGKSRLVEELLAALDREAPSPSVLRGRCLGYGEGITYWPLAEMLKAHASVLDTDSGEVAHSQVVAAAAEVLSRAGAAEPHDVAETLAASIGLGLADRGDQNPHEVRAQTLLSWCALFSAIAASAPTVVVVEDIHWADPAMLELLEEVADRATGALLLLCTARPELSTKRPAWGGMRRSFTGLRVEPFGDQDSAQLLDSLLGTDDVAGPQREAIIARAEGNPFFLEEIVRTLRSGAAGATRIPDTVQAALAARIDLLPGDEKRTLNAAAVVGRVFWPGPVSEIAAIEREVIDQLLDRLQGHDLIVGALSSTMRTQREFAFRHALVRDVAYESLPRRERVGMHTRVADWIERTFSGRREEVIELIAHHRAAAYWLDESAELRVTAFESAVEAAEGAYGRSAVKRAVQLANDARELATAPLERARALEVLGRAAHAAFDGTTAWNALREAADIVRHETPFDRTRIADICARAVIIPASEMGMMSAAIPEDEVAPYLALGLESAGDTDSEALVRLLASEGHWPFGFAVEMAGPDRWRGHAEAQRAREMAQRLGRTDLELIALAALGAADLMHGHYGLVEQYDRERLQLVRAIRDPFELADVYSDAAWTALDIGRFTESVTFGEQVDHLPNLNPIGSLALMSAARVPLGEWDPALANQARVRSLLGDQASSPPSYASAGYGAEVLIRMARGERAAAEAGLTEMWQWGRQGKRTLLWPLPSMALALARAGDFTSSRHLIDELSPYEMSRPRQLEALCTLVAEEETWAEARALVAASRRLAEEGQLLALPLHADRLEGRALTAAGDVERAVSSLQRAAAGFEQLQARWELALTQLSLGEALATLDRKQEAKHVLESASNEFERLRVPREQERAQILLRRLVTV